ncbi:hypothetical protein HU200_027037 [Digitaria exilis]|uniref:DUF7595 domain-containing protein n=1 Tax=Digitaria exilis TaxID=1010633 RepID=A0A835BWN4_9POAL|nr:hypothetical protein HU200_027037 [Digitaria exilis]
MAPAPLPEAGQRRRAPACNPPAPRKRRRASTYTPAPPPPSPPPATVPVLPANVMLEIIARSDTRTLVRCTALCKPLRRAILSPAFLRSAAAIVPPRRLLGYLHTFDMDKEDEELPDALFSVLHPDPTATTTPAVRSSFADEHLPRFVGRSAADLLGRYEPVTSRNGLVVLRRRHINRRKRSERRSDMCVYNPVTGERTFFSYPPGYLSQYYHPDLGDVYVLLTAEDGIDGCDDDFVLLVADFHGFLDSSATISVQTMSSSSDTGAWSPEKYVGDIIRPWFWLEPWRAAVVLRGGRIHWLAKCCEILTYDVAPSKPGSIRLPVAYEGVNKLHLGTSPDGRLRLLAVEGFVVSVWLLLAGGGGWELEAVIGTEAKLRSMCPDEMTPHGPARLELMNTGEKSSVALLRILRPGCWPTCGWLFVLELETREMRKIWGPYCSYLLVEIDMPSKLQTMKVFS